MCHNGLYILTILILLTASGTQAATYTWYFSDDAAGNAAGSDSNAGTEGSPFKSLSKAQDMLDTMTSGDVATLYFDRGDTWSITQAYRNLSGRITSGWTSSRDGVLWPTAGTVMFDAYGVVGDKPIFDGGETWLTNPLAVSGRNRTDAIIQIYGESNVTVQNIRFSNFFGNVVMLSGTVSNVTAQNCEASYIGGSFFKGDATGDKTTLVVQDNQIDHFEHVYVLYRLDIITNTTYWSGAISLQGGNEGGPFCGYYNVQIRRNVINYGGGEGIAVVSNEHASYVNIVENNIVANTGHVAYHCLTRGLDAGVLIVRNNCAYWLAGQPSYYKSYGFFIYDEDELNVGNGDNSTSQIYIYGNTVVNGVYGMWIYPTEDPWGKIKIFNNTIIDCDYTLRIEPRVAVTNMDIFNNSFIYYEKTGAHINQQATVGLAEWTWGPNHWYGGTLPGSPYYVP